MTSAPLTIIAIATAVAGQENALRAAQERLVAETVLETGCLRFELNQSRDDGRILIFTEQWASEPDLRWQGGAKARLRRARRVVRGTRARASRFARPTE
jgi:quinol monooxygenase YgiN